MSKNTTSTATTSDETITTTFEIPTPTFVIPDLIPVTPRQKLILKGLKITTAVAAVGCVAMAVIAMKKAGEYNEVLDQINN